MIGNVTNLAARLSDAAGPGQILITTRVQAELKDAFGLDALPDLELKGFSEKQAVYQLVS